MIMDDERDINHPLPPRPIHLQWSHHLRDHPATRNIIKLHHRQLLTNLHVTSLIKAFRFKNKAYFTIYFILNNQRMLNKIVYCPFAYCIFKPLCWVKLFNLCKPTILFRRKMWWPFNPCLLLLPVCHTIIYIFLPQKISSLKDARMAQFRAGMSEV